MNTLIKLFRYSKSVRIIKIQLAVFFLMLYVAANAQENGWVKVELFDNPYTPFYNKEYLSVISNNRVNKYPVTNVFDGNFKTCWVIGDTVHKLSSIYIMVPKELDANNLILNIMAGYGKSSSLFLANSRPRMLNVSVLVGFTPPGYVSEVSVTSFLFEYPKQFKFNLEDVSAIQSFKLSLLKDSLDHFFQNAFNRHKEDFADILKGKTQEKLTCFIVLKLGFEGFYPGTRYKDVCVSEIYLNNRFVHKSGYLARNILDVSIKNDNELIAKYSDGVEKTIIKREDLTFTNVDISSNKQWAILYYVLNDEVGEGSRTEELHSLINLRTFEVVDDAFQKQTGLSPSFIYFSDESSEVLVTDFSGEVELL
ncbi:NADase-type glycan-binding domain-containing protein [Tenuifilum thalassicum]|uniref:NADase-type glycan-binding domain-containing protein n=1 Tax=Tenuifilum thalassicum TaxID=2590900 RepID=UPI0015647F40|nr:hypothetical protein [Tenuifilum thalassicum]